MSFFKKIQGILAGGDCPAYKGGGRKCRGKLKDFVLDWEAALPEEDLEISDAQSKMADLRYIDTTEYIFYCKRAILFLSSSKILTPHPPLRPASCCGGRTDSPGGEGDGSIFWKTRETGLPSYSKICTYSVIETISASS
jgi:hypothetical protein